VPRNGELADDQVDGQTNGDGQVGKTATRRRRFQPMEPGRGRNLKVPDSLYDQMCLYARKTKIKVLDKRNREYTRSLTISEAFCKAAQSLLTKNGAADPDRPPAAE
jgi:hypothetical protein